MARWHFIEIDNSEDYLLPMGPKTVTDETNVKQSSYEYYSNADGNAVAWSQFLKGGSYSLEGVLFSQEQLETMQEWAEKDYPFIIQDYLDRKYLALCESLQLSRVRSSERWHHDWTMRFYVLREVD